MDAIYSIVDSSKLNEVLTKHIAATKRLPEVVVASAAYHVVKRTIDLTPWVPVSRIDQELRVAIAVKIGRNGQPLSPRYSKNVMKLGGTGGSGLAKTVPLTVLIIMARTRHGSNYNKRTNWRWELPSHFFKGMTREAYANVMRAMENRMINARHSSIKFLIAGWVSVRNALLPMIYGGAPELEMQQPSEEKEFGRVLMIKTSETCSVTIENLIGTAAGRMGDNSANYNRALFQHGLGPLQQAIDEETVKQMEHMVEKYTEKEIAPLYRNL